MPFLSDVKPLITGPFARFLAFWIELVTFSLALCSGLNILSLVIFCLTFFIIVLDLVLAMKRQKARKVCRILDLTYTFQPKVGIVVIDFLVGMAYMALWVLFMLWGFGFYNGYSGGYSLYNGVFGAYVLVGLLCITHMHLFIGSVELHLLRQQRNGKAAAARAHDREQSKDARTVELAEAGEQLSRV